MRNNNKQVFVREIQQLQNYQFITSTQVLYCNDARGKLYVIPVDKDIEFTEKGCEISVNTAPAHNPSKHCVLSRLTPSFVRHKILT